jgi:hypothetical protein
MGQTPNTKHQAPEKHQTSNFKPQSEPDFGVWGLVFFWSLVFGVWCFT